MTGRCRRCNRIREVPAPPSGRISDFRCSHCGGALRRVNPDGSPLARPSRPHHLATCDYCGQRRAAETLRRLEGHAFVGMPVIVNGRPVHAVELARGALVCRWHGFVTAPARSGGIEGEVTS